MVTRRRRRASTAGTRRAAPRRRRRVSGTAAVGRTRRRRRVSGTAAVGRTRPRRRRAVGSTSFVNMGKAIIPFAVGMAGGVGAQHFILRPLEQKIAQRAPWAARFFALGEIFLGGVIAMKGKSPMVKGFGFGIMAGGVQTGVKQLNLYRESPAVQGIGDYTTVRIPVNGQVRDMLSGIINNSSAPTRTSLVAGIDEDSMGYMSDYAQNRTNLLAGIWGLNDDGVGEMEADNYLSPKGVWGYDD